MDDDSRNLTIEEKQCIYGAFDSNVYQSFEPQLKASCNVIRILNDTCSTFRQESKRIQQHLDEIFQERKLERVPWLVCVENKEKKQSFLFLHETDFAFGQVVSGKLCHVASEISVELPSVEICLHCTLPRCLCEKSDIHIFQVV
jgi:hypothetical protein